MLGTEFATTSLQRRDQKSAQLAEGQVVSGVELRMLSEMCRQIPDWNSGDQHARPLCCPGAQLHDDPHIATEQHEEPHEPMEREPGKPARTSADTFGWSIGSRKEAELSRPSELPRRSFRLHTSECVRETPISPVTSSPANGAHWARAMSTTSSRRACAPPRHRPEAIERAGV